MQKSMKEERARKWLKMCGVEVLESGHDFGDSPVKVSFGWRLLALLFSFASELNRSTL